MLQISDQTDLNVLFLLLRYTGVPIHLKLVKYREKEIFRIQKKAQFALNKIPADREYAYTDICKYETAP